jgi:hypothetical protein
MGNEEDERREPMRRLVAALKQARAEKEERERQAEK